MKRKKHFFSQKTKRKLNLGFKLDRRGWTILLLILSLPMVLIFKQLLELRSLNERKASLQQQMNTANKEIGLLESEKRKLVSGNPDTIEKLAREQHKYARPGEVIYVPEEQAKP